MWQESRGFALDRLFYFCYLCYWVLIPKEYCRFFRVSVLFPNKYPYAPLVILYFTVTDFGEVCVCISFQVSFSIRWTSLGNLEL